MVTISVSTGLFSVYGRTLRGTHSLTVGCKAKETSSFLATGEGKKEAGKGVGGGEKLYIQQLCNYMQELTRPNILMLHNFTSNAFC